MRLVDPSCYWKNVGSGPGGAHFRRIGNKGGNAVGCAHLRDQKSAHEPFSFESYFVGASLEPASRSRLSQFFSGCFGDLDPVGNTRAFHAGSGIDSVTEQLKARPIPAEDACCARPAVQSKPKFQFASVGAENNFQTFSNLRKLEETRLRESDHDDCMIRLGDRKASDSDI